MPIDLILPTPGQENWAEPLNTALLELEAASNANEAATAGKADVAHVHPSTEISDFTEAVQDAVAALLAAGTNVTLNYDDAGNVMTITAASGGGGLDEEGVRDAIGVALLGVGNISVTVNDAADTITISTTATVNSTDAALRDRATHTGSQPASSISDFASTVRGVAASDSQAGAVELATEAEALTGTDTARAVTPAGLAAARGRYVGINAQTGTSYTPVLADRGKLVTLTNAAAVTVTLPQDSALAFPVEGSIDFVGLGAGLVTFQAGTGATVHAAGTTRAQYSAVSAIKIAANTWLIVGDTA